MKITDNIRLVGIKLMYAFGAVIFLCVGICAANAQPKVFPVQNIGFGAFYPGNTGGTVTISTDGSRSVAGTVVPLSLGTQFFQAIFEIEAPQGTILSILNGPDAILSGSNGGSMSLHIGNSQPLSPFATTLAPPARTPVNIGGTLSVGSALSNPAGSYSGTFSITFNWE